MLIIAKEATETGNDKQEFESLPDRCDMMDCKQPDQGIADSGTGAMTTLILMTEVQKCSALHGKRKRGSNFGKKAQLEGFPLGIQRS